MKGNSVGNIDNIINQYMALELLYNLSYAAYDLDTIKRDVTIEVSKGGETLKPIGDQEIALKQDDFIILDETGIFISFSERYRDSSKINDATVNVLFKLTHWKASINPKLN